MSMSIDELLAAPPGTTARDLDTGAVYEKETDGWWRRPGARASVNSAFLSGFHVRLDRP